MICHEEIRLTSQSVAELIPAEYHENAYALACINALPVKYYATINHELFHAPFYRPSVSCEYKVRPKK
jgi:hypothetical protein